ncbi:MAG: ATP-NAD kinase family protein [Promethearchaeota archaeon]
MKKIGFIINPIAGMGGSVGLKGTDGEIYKKAIEMGAKSIIPQRINQFLSYLENKENILMLVAPGVMGETYLNNEGFKLQVIGEIQQFTSAADTKRIARQMVQKGIILLVFCGGDGTARDIYDAIGLETPVVAIPAGVKMYSSVFALNPKAAAYILDEFLKESVEIHEKEILDIDEEFVRKDVLKVKLYGYLKVPKISRLVQSSKTGSIISRTIEENKQEITQFFIDTMDNNTLYLLGPGTTVKAITDKLNLPKTLLGIDAIYNKKIVGLDLNERGILGLLNKYSNVKIIISPIGGQGFIFGRGNKPFTPKILKLIGTQNIIIIATREKMRDINCLNVDTGDIEVDNMFTGLVKVVIGYREELVIQINH